MTRALLIASAAVAAALALSAAIGAAKASTFDPNSFTAGEASPDVRAHVLAETRPSFRAGCRAFLEGRPMPAGADAAGWTLCQSKAWGETVNRSAGCYPNCRLRPIERLRIELGL